MRAFWNGQLAGIAQISVPDATMEDAYRSGFISTQIARSGDDLDTGVNGYESEYRHNVVGILTNLFTQGDFTDPMGCSSRRATSSALRASTRTGSGRTPFRGPCT